MKLNYKRTLLVGFAFLSICVFWGVYDAVVPLILKDTFTLGETATGVIMALDNILALFMLPFFGALSDKTRTPIGRRMPYILIGTALAVVSMIFLPIADNSVSFVMFVVFLGIVLFAMGIYRAPAVALMPDVTEKPLRSKANAMINLMGAVGGILAILIMKFGIIDAPKPDYTWVFVTTAIIMVVSVVVLFFTIKENKCRVVDADEKDEDENGVKTKMPKNVFKSLVFMLLSVFLWFMAYNAVTSTFSRYAGEVWGLTGGGFTDALLVATVSAVVSYFPIGLISGKIGRKKVIMAGIILMTIAFGTGFFFKSYSPLMNLIFCAVGIGWAAINVNSYPMVVEMSKGSDVGKYTGLYYTFSMSSQIATPILSGFLIEVLDYEILFPYATVFMALAFVTMLFVKHGDSKPTKEQFIDEMEQGD